MSFSPKDNTTVTHAKEVIHEEEVGDYYRTGRSGVLTKLAHVRDHDHGKQELAAHKIVHAKEPNGPNETVEMEHKIEHVHERRTLMSGFTL